jgi:hypothetical protein
MFYIISYYNLKLSKDKKRLNFHKLYDFPAILDGQFSTSFR